MSFKIKRNLSHFEIKLLIFKKEFIVIIKLWLIQTRIFHQSKVIDAALLLAISPLFFGSIHSNKLAIISRPSISITPQFNTVYWFLLNHIGASLAIILVVPLTLIDAWFSLGFRFIDLDDFFIILLQLFLFLFIFTKEVT